LAHRIPRTKLKNDGARKSTSPETEPNFYALPFLPEDVPNPTHRVLSSEPESNHSMESIPSMPSLGSVPDSIASFLNSSNGNTADNILLAQRLAQSANSLQMSNAVSALDQLRNFDLNSSRLPTLQTSSVLSRNVENNLLAQLLYRQALENNNALSQTQALNALQQLLAQQSLSNSNLSTSTSSSSILDAARLALLQQQLQQQQQQQQQLANNLVSNNDLLALRLAITNGYTSLDQLMRDAVVGRSSAMNPMANGVVRNVSGNNGK
jgi:hypothetical protein